MDKKLPVQVHGTLHEGNARGATALAAVFLLLAPGRLDHALRPRSERPPEAAGDTQASDPRRDLLAAEALRRMPALGADAARVVAQVILDEASLIGLDPVLVLAMIAVESGGASQAVSRRGARGLMQLLRSTQAEEEREGGLPAGDPHDPAHNVRVGVRYYGRMFETFGDPDLALVAYNVGPTRLSSYIQAVGEVPDAYWSYARRVRREEQRLRRSLGLGSGEPLTSAASN